MTSSSPAIIDDKAPHIIPFILTHLSTHQKQHPETPFIIGLNGIQGAGKTTLVNILYDVLTQEHGLETLVLSIDDLYLTRADQEKLARENEGNKLVRFRGEPGTHDIPLARTLFQSLLSSQPTPIPSYDKSLHSGLGDRLPPSSFRAVNAPSQPRIRVIIFEGWCVGFRSLPPSAIESKHSSSQNLPPGTYTTLPSHPVSSLLFVNEKLKDYDVITDTFHIFIHIDAQDTQYVYEWRREQEEKLRRERGSGMSDEQVKEFVDGYYPAYELFLEGVREGVFKGGGEGEEWKGKQLRLVVGRDRKVLEVEKI
ncbi:D-glycerate 3-kinase protein [Rutstroemia sp. NJR-2017a BBW]|nr:D-glycerate 3-kinase protein [Rutstroemia sp. NJR-2017a BBW]